MNHLGGTRCQISLRTAKCIPLTHIAVWDVDKYLRVDTECKATEQVLKVIGGDLCGRPSLSTFQPGHAPQHRFLCGGITSSLAVCSSTEATLYPSTVSCAMQLQSAMKQRADDLLQQLLRKTNPSSCKAGDEMIQHPSEKESEMEMRILDKAISCHRVRDGRMQFKQTIITKLQNAQITQFNLPSAISTVR
ncbi:hypothetical protein EYF80_034725 [Liparis tanakae]|uniref:Uncharacterized protein n=1 Tax=Liparis tanakae TaxID=230148 RepID=A0A4Z2GNZ0_9TELE|nr:hypothetical protein EYF80_034725 [Liparis tanakae]